MQPKYSVYIILRSSCCHSQTMETRPKKLNPSILQNQNQTCTLTDLLDGKLTCKMSRNILIEKDFQELLASHRLRRLGITDSDTIKAIYEFPFKITREAKLCIFQFKINHNILPHGYWLYQMKILESPLCPSCGENENLMHMFVSCPNVSVFWWNVNTHSKYKVDIKRTR